VGDRNLRSRQKSLTARTASFTVGFRRDNARLIETAQWREKKSLASYHSRFSDAISTTQATDIASSFRSS
jgi:hypothetical protein